MGASYNYERSGGFTLIELSIVLVIIGLLVGGVLTGKDLIKAAAVRAQLTQIEKFNTAVSTFRGKYGYLPGDIAATAVTQFGFTTIPVRAGTGGQGDGNGELDGVYSGGVLEGIMGGEPGWFWVDLSANSGLIEGSFTSANPTPTTSDAGYGPGISARPVSLLLPDAKIGGQNSIYVWSSQTGVNYFGLSIATGIDGNGAIQVASQGLTVAQAYSIDMKVDDGLPQSGNVIAQYENWSLVGSYVEGIIWAAGNGAVGIAPGNAAAASVASCYDNGGNAANPMKYSTEVVGNKVNCALSFEFQAGD